MRGLTIVDIDPKRLIIAMDQLNGKLAMDKQIGFTMLEYMNPNDEQMVRIGTDDVWVEFEKGGV